MRCDNCHTFPARHLLVRRKMWEVVRKTVDCTNHVSILASMSDVTLGQYLKELRLKAGFSLRDLGGKVDVSAPHIGDIEQGNRQPSDDLLARLAEALSTSIEDLVRYSKRPPAKQMEELIEQNQGYSLAFRQFVDAVRENNIPPDKIHAIVKKLPPKKE